MLYNCAKKEETHHTSAYLEHTTHTQPGHITVRARGREGGQQAVTQCPNEPPPRKRQWRGKAAARGRRLEGKRIEDCARASSSTASSSRASTAAPPCAAVAGGGDVEGGVGVRQDLEQEELVVPPVAGAQSVGREHKLTPSEPSTALSLGRHHARRVSWPTRNGMQHRRACCRSMARHGSRLACHGCARSKGALSGPLLRS